MVQHQSLDPNNLRHLARRRPDSAAKSATPNDGPIHPLLSLQHQVGNTQIARLLAQREGTEEEIQPKRVDRRLAQRAGAEEEEIQTKRIDRTSAQRAADDEEEVQTKRIDRLLAQRAAPEEEEVQTKRVDRALAQRAAPEEEEIQTKRLDRQLAQRAGAEEEEVQMKAADRASAEPEIGPEGGEIGSDLAGQIQARRGQGTPLDAGTRATMEAGFGASFGNVRVHTDSESDLLNQRLSAKAFTTGSDVFFSRGAYQPDSGEGRALLSHELAHVVQQRSMAPAGPMRVSAAGDAHEQQADAAAAQVAAAPVPAQRKADDAD